MAENRIYHMGSIIPLKKAKKKKSFAPEYRPPREGADGTRS